MKASRWTPSTSFSEDAPGLKRTACAFARWGEKQAFATVAALDLLPAEQTVTCREPVQALKIEVGDFHEILSQDYALVRAVFAL